MLLQRHSWQLSRSTIELLWAVTGPSWHEKPFMYRKWDKEKNTPKNLSVIWYLLFNVWFFKQCYYYGCDTIFKYLLDIINDDDFNVFNVTFPFLFPAKAWVTSKWADWWFVFSWKILRLDRRQKISVCSSIYLAIFSLQPITTNEIFQLPIWENH